MRSMGLPLKAVAFWLDLPVGTSPASGADGTSHAGQCPLPSGPVKRLYGSKSFIPFGTGKGDPFLQVGAGS